MTEKWKDKTSYSQGDKPRTPRVCELKLEHCTVLVHRHTDYPETWLLTCRVFDIGLKDLHTDDLDEAIDTALATLLRYLPDRITELNRTIRELIDVQANGINK